MAPESGKAKRTARVQGNPSQQAGLLIKHHPQHAVGKTSAGMRKHFITFGNVALVGGNVKPFCEIGMASKNIRRFR